MPTSIPETDKINPDETCGLCGIARDQHGDKAHQFSSDGLLVPTRPKKEEQVVRHTPPNSQEQLNMNMRLIERLIAKGLLDGDDLVYIFGGINAVPRGESGSGT